MSDDKNKKALIKSNHEIEEDDSGGEAGERGQGESWTHILDAMGLDTRAMSLAEIKAAIRNYTEGNQQYSNVIDFTTGDVISKTASRNAEDDVTYYQVNQKKSGPASAREITENQSSKPEKRSEKEDKHTPSGPVLGPKPTPR
jgi:hypothetical protein